MKRRLLALAVLNLIAMLGLAAPSLSKVHTVKDGQLIMDAVRSATAGDTIRVMPGNYSETIYVDKDGILLQGVIEEGRRAVLDGGGTRNDAILFSGHGVVVEGFHIRNYKGNGIMSQGANNFTIRRNIIEDTGIYGIFPQFGKNGLVENNIVSGVEDAAIYIGMCDNLDVLGNETFGSVLGIESENSHSILIERNYVHDNAGGVSLSLVPGLPIKDSYDVIVRGNFIVNNNLANFAPPGAIAASVPAGIGILNFATDRTTIEGNLIKGNHTAGVLFIDHAMFGDASPPDNAMDPRPDENRVLHNVFVDNGSEPKDWIGDLFRVAGLDHGPDVFSSGKGRGNCLLDGDELRQLGTERWTACDESATTADLASYRLDKPIESPELTLEQKGRITYLAVCSGCHTYQARLIGPPVIVIKALYMNRPEEMAKWIAAPTKKRPDYPEMPPQDYLPPEVRLEVARYILSLK